MMTQEAGHEPGDDGIQLIAREAARHDLPVNLLCWGNLDDCITLIAAHPDTRFVIDHLGLQQPRTPPAPADPFAELPKYCT